MIKDLNLEGSIRNKEDGHVRVDEFVLFFFFPIIIICQSCVCCDPHRNRSGHWIIQWNEIFSQGIIHVNKPPRKVLIQQVSNLFDLLSKIDKLRLNFIKACFDPPKAIINFLKLLIYPMYCPYTSTQNGTKLKDVFQFHPEHFKLLFLFNLFHARKITQAKYLWNKPKEIISTYRVKDRQENLTYQNSAILLSIKRIRICITLIWISWILSA